MWVVRGLVCMLAMAHVGCKGISLYAGNGPCWVVGGLVPLLAMTNVGCRGLSSSAGNGLCGL